MNTLVTVFSIPEKVCPKDDELIKRYKSWNFHVLKDVAIPILMGQSVVYGLVCISSIDYSIDVMFTLAL